MSACFPRRTELPSPKAAPRDPSLVQASASLQSIQDADYWRKLCPSLSCGGKKADAAGKGSQGGTCLRDPALVKSIRAEVDSEGATIVHADDIRYPDGIDFTVLANAVVELMQHGWPASFLLMYDEVWAIISTMNRVMKESTGNECNMDILAWYIDPNQGHAGFSPHRDRQPDDSPATFRADGSAMYTTAWIPFTDACPENSCLYVLPRWADPGYYKGDDDEGPDPLAVALPDKESYQHIRALPVEAGGALIFTHRIIHWGSKGRVGYHTPRVSLSFGCAGDEYEPSYFARDQMPYPPVPLRAALACGQMIAYHERFDLTPKQLSLFHKVFMQHAPDFHPSYKAKVQAEYVGATLEATTGRKGLAVSGWRGMGLLTSNKADKEGAQEQGAGKANGKAGKSKGSAKAGQEAAVANGASGKAAAGAKGGKRAVEAAQLEEEEAAEARGQAPKAAAAAASKGAKEKQVKQSKKQKREPSPPPAAAEASEEDDEDEDEEELLGSFGTGGGSGDEEDEDFLDDALEAMLDAKMDGADDFEDDFEDGLMDEGEEDEDEEEDEDGVDITELINNPGKHQDLLQKLGKQLPSKAKAAVPSKPAAAAKAGDKGQGKPKGSGKGQEKAAAPKPAAPAKQAKGKEAGKGKGAAAAGAAGKKGAAAGAAAAPKKGANKK